MKSYTYIVLVVSLLFSCSIERLKKEDIDYVKIIINGYAKKANAYNKGLGAYYYSYFDLNKDSALYMYPQFSNNIEVSEYTNFAFQGKLKNARYQDTLLQLVQALSWRPVGVLNNTPEGAIYCGWTCYIEFQVGEKIKYYEVTAGISDTIDRAFEFFMRLEHYPWQKNFINSNIIDLDKEVVTQDSRFGTYAKRKIPYLFPECGNGIDFQKLEGTWRVVGKNSKETSTDRFYCYKLTPDKKFVIIKYVKGEIQNIVSGTYYLSEHEKKVFFTNTLGDKMKWSVGRLTDSCLSVIQSSSTNAEEHDVELNRY